MVHTGAAGTGPVHGGPRWLSLPLQGGWQEGGWEGHLRQGRSDQTQWHLIDDSGMERGRAQEQQSLVENEAKHHRDQTRSRPGESPRDVLAGKGSSGDAAVWWCWGERGGSSALRQHGPVEGTRLSCEAVRVVQGQWPCARV